MSGSIQYHQRCYQSPSKTPKVLPTSAAGDEGYEKGGFFTYRGDDTGYFYTATADRLSVFHHSNGYIEDAKLSFSISFGPTANVIDCIYFPLNETSPGLVVAVYDSSISTAKHKSYLAYVSLTKKRVLKKVAAPGQINSLANIIDGAQYPSQVKGLNSAFQKNWPHIIGVSIYNNGAALTHLAMTSEDDDQGEHFHKSANVIILGKAYITGDDTFVFQDDQGRRYNGKRSSQFYVSTFAFVEKCAVVIMGFPFGGIYMVSLRTQRPYAFFMAEGVIEGCAIQNADDDPRGFFYLWFTLSRGEKAHCLSAYALFPDEDEKKKIYDNPQFVFGFNFTLNDFMSFLSVKTMHIDRGRLAGSPKDPDSSGNESTAAVFNNKSSSLALFTWLSSSKPTRICGAIFDLNMFYYKRTPSRMCPDGTPLMQIPFVSGFHTDDSVDVANMEIFDISLMPSSLRAFVSVENEDKDQLFYPSVYSFSLKALTRKTAQYLIVDSIQEQFLKEVSMNFVENWLNPSDACTKFHALGIGQLPYESNDKRFYQLSTLLKHSFHFCIINFILSKECTIADLKFLHKWLKKEIEVHKENLDRSCQPLLDGAEVSEVSMRYIRFSEYFSYRICQLVEALIERVKDMEDEEIFFKHLKVSSSIANGILLYSIGIKFGLKIKMLPQLPRLLQANKDLKRIYDDVDLSNNSSKRTHSLIKLLQECMDSSPNDSIWEDKAPQEWYPPQTYNTWLGLFLMVNLSKTAKATLFGYYLHDLVKNGLWPEEKLLETSLGYFLSDDNEKLLAIKRRIEKMYKADEQILKEATVMEMDEIQFPEANKEPKSLEECFELPLMNQAEIEAAKVQFLKFPHGIHYWNKSVIQKRRYELIVIPDVPTGPEPSEIEAIREEVTQIQLKNPWVFRTNHLVPLVKEWLQESTSTEPPKKAFVVDISEVPASRKRTIDEVIDDAEEDPFLLATPIKQGRKSIFVDTPAAKAFKQFESTPSSDQDITMSPVGNVDIDNKMISNRQWERIKQITATPPATPRVNNLQWSPVASVVKQPTSILKSNKKQSRITSSTKRVRLQFDANLSQIKSIPNRHEQKAPVPDAFTMDDSGSIISEHEHQELDENELAEENDQQVAESEYGPVKLNFDIADDEDDEIPLPEAATQSDADSIEEELPTAAVEKEDETAPATDGDYEEKQDEAVVEQSFEAQEESDFAEEEKDEESPAVKDQDKAIIDQSFEAQDENDLVEKEVEQNAADQEEKPDLEPVTEVVEPQQPVLSDPEVEPPKSPRRGRPKKSASNESSVEPATLPEAAVEPPKSPRRGRPKKSASHESSVEPATLPEAAVEPPKSPRRGRPRKSASRESSVEPAVEPPKSPRRGRSRKSASRESSVEPATLPEAAVEPLKLRRGRPRKTISRESSVEPEKKPSRMQRIAVPKVKTVMEPVVEVDEPKSPYIVSEAAVPKSPRGRTRKLSSSGSESEVQKKTPRLMNPRKEKVVTTPQKNKAVTTPQKLPEAASPRRSARIAKH